uniref:Uncharacterized protein n=1 Tax=Lactuca sativa TaxID=4236 RepID=A0A9R1VC88_LACSA|nr:hypothetical protein LSAT_V11C600302360 [Lactuca sativa]
MCKEVNTFDPVDQEELLFLVCDYRVCFDKYPWGRLIWDFTYKHMCTMFDKIEDHLNPNAPRVGSRHTYTLNLSMHLSIIDGSHIPGVIPRAVAYPRMRRLHAPDCQCILDVTSCPLSSQRVVAAYYVTTCY